MVNLPARSLWVVLLAWVVHATAWGAAPGQVAGPLDISAGAVGTLQLAALGTFDQGDAESDAVTPGTAENGVTDDFAKDTWVLTTYGAVRPGDKAIMYTGHVGVGYHVVDDLSINLEALGGVVDVDHDDTGSMVELDFILRWHFAKGDDWSIYADVGAGIIYSSISVPRGGTNFNFSPQAGLGATFDLNEKAKLIVGLRYVHMSNARMKGVDNNPAWDGGMAYIGLMFPL